MYADEHLSFNEAAALVRRSSETIADWAKQKLIKVVILPSKRRLVVRSSLFIPPEKIAAPYRKRLKLRARSA